MINKIELPNILREGGLLVFCKFCKYFFWTHSQVQVWCAKATFWFVTTGWIVDVNFFKTVLWPTYKLKQRHSGVQFFNISPVVFFFFFFHYNIKPIKTSWSNLNLFYIIKCVSLFTFYRFQAIKCARRQPSTFYGIEIGKK